MTAPVCYAMFHYKIARIVNCPAIVSFMIDEDEDYRKGAWNMENIELLPALLCVGRWAK